MAVSISGPVGRRFRRENVANRADDQMRIIGLLAKIPRTDGGKKEEWAAPPLPGPTGTCPSHLEQAIWDFQEHWKRAGHFRNIDGVVDPDRNTLAQLNLLAAGVTPPPPLPGPPTPFVVPLAQNPNITLDGTQALDRTPPMHPAEWIRRTRETFDTICRSPVGKQVVQRLGRLFVVVRVDNDLNAGASHVGGVEVVTFTADNFDGHVEPGTRADEMLLHELIHIAERHFGLYDNGIGNVLKYARAEFLAITGTNVYSSALGRGLSGLRADHDGFRRMPAPFDTNPAEHATVFRANYQKALGNDPALFGVFRGQSAPWNPFRSFTP